MLFQSVLAAECSPVSAVIAATNGTTVRVGTVHPAACKAFKRWQAERDAIKGRRDVLQADRVQILLDGYLPQVSPPAP